MPKKKASKKKTPEQEVKEKRSASAKSMWKRPKRRDFKGSKNNASYKKGYNPNKGRKRKYTKLN